MDALRFAIAATPLAAYLLVLGSLSASRRGVVINGASELATLGAALSGAAFVGPLALFRPLAATAEMDNLIWLFLLALYWLSVTLAVLLCRPRLVVINRTAEELRPLVADAVRRLDPAARWAGETVSMPTLGVELHLESFHWLRNTTLAASGAQQDLDGWRRFGVTLDRSLRASAAPRSRTWLPLIAGGAALLAAVAATLAGDPGQVSESWSEIFAF